jgi:hypothetical protein
LLDALERPDFKRKQGFGNKTVVVRNTIAQITTESGVRLIDIGWEQPALREGCVLDADTARRLVSALDDVLWLMKIHRSGHQLIDFLNYFGLVMFIHVAKLRTLEELHADPWLCDALVEDVFEKEGLILRYEVMRGCLAFGYASHCMMSHYSCRTAKARLRAVMDQKMYGNEDRLDLFRKIARME